jgi:hypothetical protein
MAYGWAGTAAEFLRVDVTSTAHVLGERHRANYRDSASHEQQDAWSHELQWLAASLHTIPQAAEWGVVLEYELPFEGGRRPDVVLLAGDAVVVLEFKERSGISRADIDQVDAYARDLQDYHSACRGHQVRPVLVLPNRGGLNDEFEGVPIVGPDYLPATLVRLAGSGPQIPVDHWLAGTYAPLPTLVSAAKRVFEHEPLPLIKRAESAGIPELLAWLTQLVAEAKSRRERHLVLITGVPGSGKTLVGLQFVHSSRGDSPEAVFLSGNGPLVTVLQDALRTTVFVRPMHNFDLEYGIRRRGLPPQHVFVFDEAQRAWDAAKVLEHKAHDRSEPEILLDVTGSVADWGVAIGLVGEGQEIHVGEEAGIGQWADALAKSDADFTVHVPPRLAPVFGAHTTLADPRLDLTTSLRTHRAERVQDWVASFLNAEVDTARDFGRELAECGFDLYVTKDLLRAKRYVLRRYEDQPEKRYGLLASSKARNLAPLGIDNEYQATLRLKIGPWFNAPSSDARSSCQLAQPATEFQCQGLELDMPILCWGDDLGWVDASWQSFRRTVKAKDSHQLRLNSYRVLLTRGRDGVIVFVPDNLRAGQQAALTSVLVDSGAKMLEAGT